MRRRGRGTSRRRHDRTISEPFVSIIVNNFNYARFLGEAVESALRQTYARREVIVVDDGSTDGSREVISRYGNDIIPLLKENGGQASAFNAGFDRSRGDIVVFLDADDYLYPHAVERVVAAWGPRLSKLHYRLDMVDARGNHMGSLPPLRDRLDSGDVLPLLLKRGRYESPVTSGNAFHRSTLAELLPMPENDFRIAADGFLVNLAPFYGEVGAIDEALGAFRAHGGNRWAIETVSGVAGATARPRPYEEQLRALVRHHVLTQELITKQAVRAGRQVPGDLTLRTWQYLRVRVASLRLDANKHPVKTDEATLLMRSGLRALWRYSELGASRRVLLSMWFVWVTLVPLPLARPAIEAFYAPDALPPAIGRLVERVRRKLVETSVPS